MESSTQLDLLKERIEYDETVFGKPIKYYGFADSEDKYIYTLNKNPQIGDMTFEYVEQEMVLYNIIENVVETDNVETRNNNITTDSITVDGTVYYSTDEEKIILGVYIKVLKRLLEDSKYVGLSLRFPYEEDWDIELPKKYLNWQLRCATEIYEQIGTIGIKLMNFVGR